LGAFLPTDAFSFSEKERMIGEDRMYSIDANPELARRLNVHGDWTKTTGGVSGGSLVAQNDEEDNDNPALSHIQANRSKA